MIDFGLVALFAVQVAMVGLVYHAWAGIRSEIVAVRAQREEVKSAMATIAALAVRVNEVEGAPKAQLKRIQELEAAVGKVESSWEKSHASYVSLSARVSAMARGRKKAEDQDPAPQGESENSQEELLPGSSSPPQYENTARAIPPGFGRVRRFG